MVYVYYGRELYHHGVKGQKWGVRNGPPYPIKRSSNDTGKTVEKSSKNSKISAKRAYAKSPNDYRIEDPATGEYFYLAEGTRIQNPTVFAGKGRGTKLKPETVEGLVSEYKGSNADDWQHCKGDGVVDYYGEEREAEIHWFQEKSVGRCKLKIKKWLD